MRGRMKEDIETHSVLSRGAGRRGQLFKFREIENPRWGSAKIPDLRAAAEGYVRIKQLLSFQSR